MTEGRKRTDLDLVRRVLRQARPFARYIVGAFLLGLLATPLALLTPLPLMLVVDHVIGSEPLPALLAGVLPADPSALLPVVAVLLVLVALLQNLQAMSSGALTAWVGEHLTLRFRGQLFDHVQRLSIAHHDRSGSNDQLYRIQWDAPAIRHLVIDGAIPCVTSAMTLLAMLYVTFRIDWQLTAIAVAVAPVLFLLARAWRARLRTQARELKRNESAGMAVAQEVMSSLRVVKVFGQEAREQRRFVRRSEEVAGVRVRVAWAEGRLGLMVGTTVAIGTAAVMTVGAIGVRNGTLRLGELLLAMGYLAQLYAPVKTISKKTASMQLHLAAAERAFELLESTPEVLEAPHARPLSRAAGAVRFCDVGFAYDGGRTVLQRTNLDVPAGSRIGIAGRTGAGKSTLVGLLCRLYEPTHGRILLDGVDIAEYRVADLRRQFAIVMQEPILFSTTIAENIAYGCPDASQAEIEAAAVAANAHEFITAQPAGYQAQVGERGVRLSGGERQRITLARAFLKDAPILILDEPTSALDVATEASVLEALERLMRGRTCFLIAHRASTLANCDQLFVLADGSLSRAELPRAGGAAARRVRGDLAP
ncbi:MAG TPA: ABC transporter ATP-binding protein [Planctomycetota bacterium]